MFSSEFHHKKEKTNNNKKAKAKSRLLQVCVYSTPLGGVWEAAGKQLIANREYLGLKCLEVGGKRKSASVCLTLLQYVGRTDHFFFE
jgi:hypothetical protein